MNAILILLDVAAGAVVVTVLLALGQRWRGLRAARHRAAYRAVVRDHLAAFAAGARDDPPPRPTTTFERRVMRQDLVAIAPQVKGDAARGLARAFADYGLIRLARHDLESRDSLTRIRAAEALGSMEVERAEPWLRERLTHHDPLLQLAVARALAQLHAVDALPDIVAALAESGAESGEVAEILLTFGPLAVPFLRARVSDAPPAERRLAVGALGEIRDRAACPELRRALADPDDEVAAGAARALGQIGDAGAVELVLDALTDPRRRWFVHVAAAGALGALDDPRAAPALVTALSDDQWDVRNAAARALRRLGQAGLQAVCDDLDDVPDAGVAHFAGVLDVEDAWGDVVRRAALGERGLPALVRRAAGAGVTARLEEQAADPEAPAHDFAAELLVRREEAIA